MFDRYLRPLKDRLLAPCARAAGPRLSPNALTWLAFIIGMASATAAFHGDRWTALALWLLNRVLDGLDGTHARTHGLESAYGGYLDIVLDFAVYAAVPIALAASRAPEPGILLAALLLVASFYINAASWMYLAAILEQRRQGAGATGESTTITMPPGLIGGTETVVFYAAFFLWPASLSAIFGVMSALVLLTVVLRLAWAARRL
ncbi:MAG: CDP-alcohol phosphatidyltransferase family protein [Vicinamibacterales bacterium]